MKKKPEIIIDPDFSQADRDAAEERIRAMARKYMQPSPDDDSDIVKAIMDSRKDWFSDPDKEIVLLVVTPEGLIDFRDTKLYKYMLEEKLNQESNDH